MNIKNRRQAVRYLTHINYYRLRAYWLLFEGPANANGHTFRAGTQLSWLFAKEGNGKIRYSSIQKSRKN